MNSKWKLFAEYYAANPNAAEAARQAGYSAKTARYQGNRLLANVDIAAYIKEIQNKEAERRIASMLQIQAFWSDVMFNEDEKMTDRLKASELLAKAMGQFTAFALNIAAKSDTKESNNDVVIYIPQKLTEEECTLYDDDETSDDVIICMPEIESEESCKPKYRCGKQ